MKLVNGNIPAQEMLTDTAQRAEKVTPASPQACRGVGMHFADAVAVVIACPCLVSMRYCRTRTLKGMVAVVCIGVQVSLRLSEWFHLLAHRRAGRIADHPQTHLLGFTSNRPQYRRTVIGKGAPSPPFIGAPPRRVAGVEALDPFFPPRSETSRRFRLLDPAGQLRLVADDAPAAPSFRSTPVPAPVAYALCPEARPEVTAPHAGELTGFRQTACRCSDDKSPDTTDGIYPEEPGLLTTRVAMGAFQTLRVEMSLQPGDAFS
jgi:hypothetical protein